MAQYRPFLSPLLAVTPTHMYREQNKSGYESTEEMESMKGVGEDVRDSDLDELRKKRLAYFSQSKEESDIPVTIESSTEKNGNKGPEAGQRVDVPFRKQSACKDSVVKRGNVKPRQSEKDDIIDTLSEKESLPHSTTKASSVTKTVNFFREPSSLSQGTLVNSEQEGVGVWNCLTHNGIPNSYCHMVASTDIEQLGLSTHRPDSNRALQLETGNRALESFTAPRATGRVVNEGLGALEDTLCDSELRQLLGEEKYQEFLEKSRRDIEALKLERKNSPGRLSDRKGKNASNFINSGGREESMDFKKGDNSKLSEDLFPQRLNRPKHAPALVSSFVVKSRGELDRELPLAHKDYGVRNYDQTSMSPNVVYSSNQIYKQAYDEIPHNPYLNYNGMYQGTPQTFSPRDLETLMYQGYPAPSYRCVNMERQPNHMYGQPMMFYSSPNHPASSMMPHSPHPTIFASPRHPFSPHPPHSGRGSVTMSQNVPMSYPYSGSSHQSPQVYHPVPQPPWGPPHGQTSDDYIPTSQPLTQPQDGSHHHRTCGYRHESYHHQPLVNGQHFEPAHKDICVPGTQLDGLTPSANYTVDSPIPHPPAGHMPAVRHTHREHVDGVRHFHENRRRQGATDVKELNSSEQYAVDRLEKYFSSIESYYVPKAGRSFTSLDEEHLTAQTESPMDEELETLVASTITNLKAGGVTERLKELGIDVPFLNCPLPRTEANGDSSQRNCISSKKKTVTEPNEAKMCTECSALNKSYMSWCGNCGEVLIGVEAMVVSSKPRQVPVQLEGEDSGFDDRVSPPKPKVHFAEGLNHVFRKIHEIDSERLVESSSSERCEKGQKLDTVDSGRGASSGEDREKAQHSGRMDKEIIDICQSIGDPVIRSFLKSYLRKRNWGCGTSIQRKKTPTSGSQNKESNKMAVSRSTEEMDNFIDNQDVWLHEARPTTSGANDPVSGEKPGKAIDIEVFGLEDGQSSRTVSRNGHEIPLLDLGFSSDEEAKQGKQLDLSLTDEDEDGDELLGKEMGQGDAPLSAGLVNKLQADPRVVSVHCVKGPNSERKKSLKGKIKKPGNVKPSPGRDKRFPQNQTPSIVRASIEAKPPKRHWMRSSIAWSSYNHGELSKDRSLPPQGRRRGQKSCQGLMSHSAHVQKDGSSSADSNEDSPLRSQPHPQKRPASADILRRKAKVETRPDSAGGRRKSSWEGQRDINLKSRTLNMRKILGVLQSDDVTEVSGISASAEGEQEPKDFVPIPVPVKTAVTTPVPHPAGVPDHVTAQSAYDMYHSMTPRISEGTFSIWLCIPDEILLFILSHLSLADLARCAMVCKQFYRVAMDQSLWKSISMTKRQDLSDDMLDVIGRRQPISLSLIQCHGNNITANGLQRMFQHCGSYLEELNISRCSRGALVGDVVLRQASVQCKHLTHLDVSWTYVTDSGLSTICSTAHRLESVCINGCPSITNNGLETLLRKHGKSLRVLELCGCFNINQTGIRSIAHNCHNLLTLNLGQCYKLTDSSVAEVTGSLPRLESLDIRGCNRSVRDTSVRKIVKNCPRLSSIALANCPHISDVALSEIATYLPGMKWIDLCGCKNITDESLRTLAKNCPNLYYLDISSTSCTKKSILALAAHCSKKLEVAKLNFLSDIDENSILRLVKACTSLSTLHLYGCKGVQTLADKLKKERPNVSVEMG
ncbi:uncharacterized protein LOC135466488 [Liolophura sinensis]|uniref:uncharacterized protein LOC135466488 n=1 Tax=Liolophura sinensis TaxID=3198878 RepID=UPI00315859D7